MNIVGQQFKNIYKSLLSLSDAIGFTSVLKQISDSAGNVVPLWISTLNVKITSLQLGYVAVTSTYLILTTDLLVDCTTGSFTVTLPTAVSVVGKQYVLVNSGSGVITVATTSSQTINSSVTQVLNSGNSITVISNGANWIII